MAEGLSVALRQVGPIQLDLQFQVAAGETLALVGPSGSGKTTVLRAIAGLYRPRSGRISCAGETWFASDRKVAVAPHHRKVGFLFQSYALFPHLTAAENVEEALLDRPRMERRDIAAALLERVHLGGLGRRLPTDLSGGQQQRVALARALARDPQVLLLDEPFSAVDHPTRRALHRLLAEIRESTAVPIVLVSHDIEDAVQGADRLCLLSSGRSIEQGAPRALLDDPRSRLSQWLASG